MKKNGEEIKKLILNGTVSLHQLNTAELGKLMNYETDLLCKGEGDMALIKECSALLDEKRADENWAQRFDTALETATSTASAPKRRNTALRRITTIAASVAVLITASTFVASAFGFNALAFVMETIYGKEDSFVFLYNESGREYTSMKEMVESEGLDIMYPTKMPKGVDIVSVTLADKDGSRRELRIATSDNNSHIVIQIAMGQGLQLPSNIGTHVINGCNYYVFGDSAHYYAFCYYKDDYYSFQASNYKDLILIIENMEE